MRKESSSLEAGSLDSGALSAQPASWSDYGLGSNEVTITLVNRDAYHNIRVRNYEADLSHVRVQNSQRKSPLKELLEGCEVMVLVFGFIS